MGMMGITLSPFATGYVEKHKQNGGPAEAKLQQVRRKRKEKKKKQKENLLLRRKV